MKKLGVFAPAFVAVIWAFICFGGCINHNPAPVTSNWYCATIDPPKSTERGAFLNGKSWPVGSVLRIGFMGGTAQYQQRVKDAYAEIAKEANLKFTYPASGPFEIRWSFNPNQGAYSYLGRDCLSIPQSVATGNIGFRNANNLGVEIHEANHSLAAIHEQSQSNANICWNKSVVYADLARTNGWSTSMVDQNVFFKYTASQNTATAYDQTSVMQYNVPGTWVCSGVGIPGGNVLSELDKAILRLVYPGTVTPTDPPITGTFTLTLQQRKALLTRAQGVQNAAQISLAAAAAAKVAADSSVAFTKRTLGL